MPDDAPRTPDLGLEVETGTGALGLPLARRVVAEALGSALLIVAVIGSGIMATRLSPDDVGLQLLENAIATGGALVGLILMMGAVSGAHFNPVVTLVDSHSAPEERCFVENSTNGRSNIALASTAPEHAPRICATT